MLLSLVPLRFAKLIAQLNLRLSFARPAAA
jgi:hypothetical protein